MWEEGVRIYGTTLGVHNNFPGGGGNFVTFIFTCKFVDLNLKNIKGSIQIYYASI